MGAKTPPKTVQKHPKRSCFSPFFSGFWCQMPPSAPQDAQDSEIWSKKSPQDPPDLLWTLISIQFWTISYEILKDFSSSFASLCSPLLCFALRCFTGSTTNHPHYQNNASTRQPHFRNNISLPARWRVMRSTWDNPKMTFKSSYSYIMIRYDDHI